MLKRLVCWWSGHRYADLPTWRYYHHRKKRWYSIVRSICTCCDDLKMDQYEAFEWEA